MKSIVALPPLAIIIGFKFFLKSTFDTKFTWYIPSGSELERVHQHHADARKNRLLKRFGHPSLHAELFTPMIHKDHQSLLSAVYSGRIHDTGDEEANGTYGEMRRQSKFQNELSDHSNAPVPEPYAGGLKFAAIAQHDLMYSQQQFLRERDEDEMSLASTALVSHHPKAPGHAASLSQDLNIQNYMRDGPGMGKYAQHESPWGMDEEESVHKFAPQDSSERSYEEAYEMARVRTAEAEAQERLLRLGTGSPSQFGYVVPFHVKG